MSSTVDKKNVQEFMNNKGTIIGKKETTAVSLSGSNKDLDIDLKKSS